MIQLFIDRTVGGNRSSGGASKEASSLSLEVESSERVSSVQNIVTESAGILLEQQNLRLAGNELEDQATLGALTLVTGPSALKSTLQLTVMEHCVTNARKKASSSSKVNIDFEPMSTTAGELVRLLSPKIGVPASLIKLSCKRGAPLIPLPSPHKAAELGEPHTQQQQPSSKSLSLTSSTPKFSPSSALSSNT